MSKDGRKMASMHLHSKQDVKKARGGKITSRERLKKRAAKTGELYFCAFFPREETLIRYETKANL